MESSVVSVHQVTVIDDHRTCGADPSNRITAGVDNLIPEDNASLAGVERVNILLKNARN